MTAPTATTSLPGKTPQFERLRQRHAWKVVIVAIFAAMVVWRASQVPMFAGFEIRTITAGALAVALLAMAQGVVVISGGINMAVGSLLVLVNCIAAKYMEGQGFVTCLLIAVGCLVVSAALSGLMGWIINVSHVPDIVVTLALSFTFTGAAWLVIRGPGGGADPTFKNMLVGGFSDPLPSIIVMVVVLAAIWYPFSRSRSGLAMYAMGSSKQTAFLAGVDVASTRVKVYLLSGVFAGLAGLVTTAYTGGGEPRASIGLSVLMSSVAAAVLGGISLSGGTGGLFGPVIAAMVLGLIPAILMGIGLDPNYAEVVRGVIIIIVVMIGGMLQMRRRAT
ncbi:MAG: ABC transporter permease [Propionicimonas sp.]|uniref:ABC transporter permease n=1 Tax=Propionicimonas sp. TaxID=1955623 RepID=UPI002B21C35D|nr:ABC transporter permease [Propionicimonas sp.]MEA4945549.1 ABC transporter permease [Propionicimonas sp.]